jgi:hypothetical protein
MCMHACEKQDGVLTDFHLGHYGNLAVRGLSLAIVKASSVEPGAIFSHTTLGFGAKSTWSLFEESPTLHTLRASSSGFTVGEEVELIHLATVLMRTAGN